MELVDGNTSGNMYLNKWQIKALTGVIYSRFCKHNCAWRHQDSLVNICANPSYKKEKKKI